MLILGLTGSIAMGKSTAAAMFRQMGVPVHDADRTIHCLLAPRGAGVRKVAAAFPGIALNREGGIDRASLAARVFGDTAALRQLEAVLHPFVIRDQDRFVGRAARARRSLVVLDIPLLFETGAEDRCDAVAVVTAPAFVQLQRLLSRPGMDRERIAATLRRQMPDAEKRKRADFVIPSGLGKAQTRRAVAQIVAFLRERQGAGWLGRQPPSGA